MGLDREQDQIWTAYKRWQWKIELYSKYKLSWFKVFLTVLSAYKTRDSLVFKVSIWYLKFSSKSKKTHKNFIAGTLSSFVTLLMALMLSAEYWSGLLLLQKISIFAIVFVLEKSKKFSFVWIKNQAIYAKEFCIEYRDWIHLSTCIIGIGIGIIYFPIYTHIQLKGQCHEKSC